MIRIWVIHGTHGDYEGRQQWVVEGWRDASNAEARVVELRALVIEHNEKQTALDGRYPWKWQPDDDGELWTKWRAEHDRLLARYRRRARDESFGERDTEYSVVPLPLRGEFK